MSKPRLTEQQKQEMLLLYANGTAVATIAEKFGVCGTYPGILARRRGMPMRMDATARANFSAGAIKREARAAVREARRNGNG